MSFLDRLVDLLFEWFTHLLPWHVMPDDEIGLVQRLGRYSHDLSPGLNWKWPVFDAVTTTSGAVDSSVLREQTLTTKDGKQVTIRGILTYKATSPRKYILEVEDAESVLNDVGCAVIAESVPERDAEHVLASPKFTALLRRRVSARSKNWGIKVQSFAIMDRSESVAIRLISGTGE